MHLASTHCSNASLPTATVTTLPLRPTCGPITSDATKPAATTADATDSCSEAAKASVTSRSPRCAPHVPQNVRASSTRQPTSSLRATERLASEMCAVCKDNSTMSLELTKLCCGPAACCSSHRLSSAALTSKPTAVGGNESTFKISREPLQVSARRSSTKPCASTLPACISESEGCDMVSSCWINACFSKHFASTELTG
eukprot:scaffold172869_cov27-Tisochrysis_lutea.AAC.2